jgi:hypothetical protein
MELTYQARRRRRTVPLLLAVLALGGCRADPYVAVADWTLSTSGGASSAIHAPQRLDDILPKQPTTYFLDAEVRLPEALRRHTLTLTWPGTDAFATLVVDGETILPLTITPVDRVRPSQEELVFRIPERQTARETLHLQLQVKHVDSWTSFTGLPLRLAAAPYGERQEVGMRYAGRTLGFGLAAIFLLLALVSGVSFLLDRRRSADGWYALLTLTIAINAYSQLGLFQLIEPRDWMRIQLASAGIGNVAGIYFTRAYFRLRRTRLAHVLALAVAALCLLNVIVSWAPFASYPRAVALAFVQFGLAIVYVLVMLVQLARKPEHRLEALCMLGAYGVIIVANVLASFVEDLTAHLTQPIAFVAFVITQGVLVLRNHAREMRALNTQLEDRVVMLEDRNREVSRLNDELRRQIHERSARLGDALGRIGKLSRAKIDALVTGARIGDRYVVVRSLGQGGMGVVYEVERTTDAKHFALKTLLHADSGTWLARLAREAQAATAIVHPNVVDIVDIDVDASGMPFIVMELVKGEPLSRQQTRFGDAKFAREVVRQIAAGLSALHEAGIVHRDLKPGNVLLERRQDDSFCAKIVDFGIARVATGQVSRLAIAAGSVLDTDGFIPFVRGETAEIDAQAATASPAGAALTGTGWLLGTPLYMAPELAGGVKDAPPSCDLWSLGVLAYQVGCGKLPFIEPPVNWTGESEWKAQVDMQQLAQPLRRIVERCLDVDPLRRPSAAEVAAALG